MKTTPLALAALLLAPLQVGAAPTRPSFGNGNRNGNGNGQFRGDLDHARPGWLETPPTGSPFGGRPGAGLHGFNPDDADRQDGDTEHTPGQQGQTQTGNTEKRGRGGMDRGREGQFGGRPQAFGEHASGDRTRPGGPGGFNPGDFSNGPPGNEHGPPSEGQQTGQNTQPMRRQKAGEEPCSPEKSKPGCPRSLNGFEKRQVDLPPGEDLPGDPDEPPPSEGGRRRN